MADVEQGLYYPDGSFKSREDMLAQGSVFERATDILKRTQELAAETSIGVREATWKPELQYPNLPLLVLLATDMHYGGIGVDYATLEKHLLLVENTPNTGMVTNGDDVDNFCAIGKTAAGMFENPLPPQIQTKALLERLKQLDALHKLGAMSFGNHNNFMEASGYDWLETFCQGMESPIFTAGGLLHIKVGNQSYDMGITHKYWGASKLNPTNAAKRFWEHEHPEADIVFLGHTHQSEVLSWERGGKQRLAVIGGTYKVEDQWARTHGIGGHPGEPGTCVFLFPQEHRMVGMKNIEDAVYFMRALIRS